MPIIVRIVAAEYPHPITKHESKGGKEWIGVPDNPDEMKGVREKTRTGRPQGEEI